MIPGPDNFVATTGYYTPLTVLVNLAGRRFVDESISDDASARAAIRQPEGRVVAIYDARADEKRVTLDPSGDDRIAAAVSAGAELLRADDFDELLDGLAGWSLPRTAIQRSIDGFNRAMTTADWGILEVPRVGHRHPLVEPPFFAIQMNPALTATFGGLRVDGRCGVLDRHGQPIPGLFAAGADAGGAYVDVYGGGLGAALATGWVAGGVGS
jgi:hypothetical protein